MRITGKDVALYAGTERIALATSCDIQVDRDMVEFMSQTSARSKRYKPGRYSWTASVDTLVAEGSASINLLEALTAGSRILITMTAEVKGGQSLSGYAYVKSWSENAPLSGMVTVKATFIGDGDLSVHVDTE